MKTTLDETFLSFELKNELFAINVGKVIEVLEKQDINKVPDAPDFMSGVINFRGKVIPVLNLACKLNFPEYNNDSFVIIVMELSVESETLLVGVMCDKVNDVLHFNLDKLTELPDLGMRISSNYAEGIMNFGDTMITLLNLNSIVMEQPQALLAE